VYLRCPHPLSTFASIHTLGTFPACVCSSLCRDQIFDSFGMLRLLRCLANPCEIHVWLMWEAWSIVYRWVQTLKMATYSRQNLQMVCRLFSREWKMDFGNKKKWPEHLFWSPERWMSADRSPGKPNQSPRVGSHCTLGAYGTLDPSVEVDGLSHPSVFWLRSKNFR